MAIGPNSTKHGNGTISRKRYLGGNCLINNGKFNHGRRRYLGMSYLTNYDKWTSTEEGIREGTFWLIMISSTLAKNGIGEGTV